MSNRERDNSNFAESAQSQAGSKIIHWLNAFLDKLYRNRRDENPPNGITGQVWGMSQTALPLPWAADSSHREHYFLHYFQSQNNGPTKNECVTTSALMSMNMLKDWAASQQGCPCEPDRDIETYTHELDALGLQGWKYRFSTNSPLPGMMTPWQALITLKDHAKSLKEKYQKSYRVKLSAHNKLMDLIEHLRQGSIILIHGAWQIPLERNPLLAFLGGMPHTMLLVGYDGNTSQWLLLNPSDPSSNKNNETATPKIYKMNTKQLMDFWGRKFLFYPPRFSFTAVTLDL
ncbi:MAG: hypothetical protein HOP27_04165 [Anaerolineales bacterium]|nr:hypothetical protein [Anaerolineales bacterium]